jgi:two-component system response regulator RegA
MPHVLVVEDDPFTARRLLRLLVSRGVCQVRHATTVAQALGLLDPPPDWVILDMNLPDGTGLPVLEAIRKADLPTRVIVSSATKDADLVAAFAVYKPDVILPKPLDPARLPIGRGKND